MDCDFSNGAIVRMKSGGPDMTVVHVIGDAKEDKFVFIDRLGFEIGDVVCEWWDGNRKKSEIISRKTLVLVSK